MSRFGSLFDDADDDVFFGNHLNDIRNRMRSMNNFMNSFMRDPFLMPMAIESGSQSSADRRRTPAGSAVSSMGSGSFFDFPALPDLDRLVSANPTGMSSSYCSSAVMTMRPGTNGRPEVYQASYSTKTGPGGVRETRKAVQDTRAGIRKMAIGHHIGDRAHIIEKGQDLRSGQMEEHQEYINLDEDEAAQFDHEFTSKAFRAGGSAGGSAATAPAIGGSGSFGGGSKPKSRTRRTVADPHPLSSALTVAPVNLDDDAYNDEEREETVTNYQPQPPRQQRHSKRRKNNKNSRHSKSSNDQ